MMCRLYIRIATYIKRCWLILGIHSFQIKILGCVSRHQGRVVAWPKQLCDWRQLGALKGDIFHAIKRSLLDGPPVLLSIFFCSHRTRRHLHVFRKAFASFLRARLAVRRLRLIPTRYAICRNRIRIVCVPLPFVLFLPRSILEECSQKWNMRRQILLHCDCNIFSSLSD